MEGKRGHFSNILIRPKMLIFKNFFISLCCNQRVKNLRPGEVYFNINQIEEEKKNGFNEPKL